MVFLITAAKIRHLVLSTWHWKAVKDRAVKSILSEPLVFHSSSLLTTTAQAISAPAQGYWSKLHEGG